MIVSANKKCSDLKIKTSNNREYKMIYSACLAAQPA